MPDPITDPKELEQFLTAPMQDLPAGTGGAMIGLAPVAKQIAGPSSTERLIQENARPEVPFQVNPPEDSFGEGIIGNVSPWTRFQTARRQTLEDQQKYLETVFPGKVRKAKNSDDFIIELPDPETGKPRDVLLNEQQITLGDVAALAGHSPEMALAMLAGGGVGALLSKAPGLLRGAGVLTAAATGFKAGEAGQQLETRLEQGQPLEVGATLAEKGKEIPGQLALDTATLGVFKVGQLALNLARGKVGPGMFQTAVQKEGLAASEELAGKYGPRINYTGAQASGMPLLAFLEAYAEAKPQATAIVAQFRELEKAEAKALAESITARAGTDEEAGNRLLQFLGQNQQAKQQALDNIRKTMTKEESDYLTRQLGKYGRVVSPFQPSQVGGQLRSDFQSAYQGVKSRVGQAYKDAYGVPGAEIPAVPTKPIADEIDSLLERFPTVEGAQWLRGYKKQLAPQESYRDIVNRRSDLWNKIESSPADRETKDYIHGQLSKAMSETLDDASKTIINPRFRSLIQNANQLYKTEELPFYQKGLRDVLMKSGVPGAPENIQLLDRFAESTDLYRRLIAVVGKDSPTAKTLNSSIIDGLLTKSGTSAIDPQFVDADLFIKNLTEFASNRKTREIFQDIFGSRGKSLLAQAKVLKGIQGTLSKEDAAALLTSGAATVSRVRLQRVLNAQKQMDGVEAHRIVQGPVDNINPEQFVNRFVSELPETELKSVADRLKRDAPALYGQVQDKMVEQILGKSGTYETWSRSSIEKVLNDPKMRPKYEALLGDKFRDVELFAKALGPQQYAREMAEGTGMLVKGQSVGALARIFRYKPGQKSGIVMKAAEEVPPWLGWKIAGRIITSGAFRQWSERSFPPLESVIMPAIVSEPFLAEIASSTSSPAVIKNLVMALRGYQSRVSHQSEKRPAQSPVTDPKELEQFLTQ